MNSPKVQPTIINGNGRVLVLSRAEAEGKVKYYPHGMGWYCAECVIGMRHNGVKGKLECPRCGTSAYFKEMSARQKQALDGLVEQGEITCVNGKYQLPHTAQPVDEPDKPYDAIAHLETRFSCKVRGVISAERINGNGSFKAILSAKQKSGLDSTIDTTLDTATLKSLGWTPPKPKVKAKPEAQALPRFSLFRPSLIVAGTPDEMQTANALDAKQIVNGNDGVLAYLINGKVTISFCGTMELATRMGITISDIETKQAYHLAVATAKAHNPATGNTFAGAHSSPKLLSGLRPNPNAETIATGLAKRNAVLKVVPEVEVYKFANHHAKNVGASGAVASTEGNNSPSRVNTHKKQKETLTGEINKSHWARTIDGQIVAVTETGTSASTSKASQKRTCPAFNVTHK